MVEYTQTSVLAILTPVLPLSGFIFIILFSRLLKGKRSGILATLLTGFSFVFSFLLFLKLNSGQSHGFEVDLFSWIAVGKLTIPFSFLIDPLSVTMMMIITGVGFLIHLYSIGYMKGDERFNAFFAYMNLFTAAMLLLVMGSNYLLLFIGWEGVGLCSYLLIGFWFKNNAFNDAARKAFIMNRIGDLGFILGIIALFYTFQTLSFSELVPKLSGIQPDNPLIITITLLLFLGAIGKSAQIPLFTWLPDAMAGPTPVSALIHAATMVTAGIYMIARSSALFNLAPLTQDVIMVTGLSTALFAATIGLFQNDIKKVLAYSTVSQLGYMFVALGLGVYSGAVFHVTTHAFFKALLFMGAGSVIHAMHGEQDIRNMGGLKSKMPITYFTFLAGTIAISGFPPFSGFFSKDQILMAAWAANPVIYGLGLLGALLTCFYMFRLLFLVFHSSFRGTAHQQAHLHESPAVMTVPLIILAILSVLGGFLNLPELFGGHRSFSHFLGISVADGDLAFHKTSHAMEYLLLLISVLALLSILLWAAQRYVKKQHIPPADNEPVPGLQRLVYHKYYIDELYDRCFVKPYTFLSVFFDTLLEKRGINHLVNGIGRLFSTASEAARKLQTGNISFYVFAMIIGILAFLIINLVV